jgi:hypothetical protein
MKMMPTSSGAEGPHVSWYGSRVASTSRRLSQANPCSLPGPLADLPHAHSCEFMDLARTWPAGWQVRAGQPIAAICATPAVFLASKGILGGKQRATAHPAFSDKLPEQRCADAHQGHVVRTALVSPSVND